MEVSYAPIISEAAKLNDITQELVAAVILQESGGYAYAARYEEGFFNRYLKGKQPRQLLGYFPKTISIATEYAHRATSWGLMQIMGQVARERGFNAESLVELIDPSTNIHLGASILRSHLDKTKDLRKSLLRYNGGGNPSYADEVLSIMEGEEINHIKRGRHGGK